MFHHKIVASVKKIDFPSKHRFLGFKNRFFIKNRFPSTIYFSIKTSILY
eukprot:UN27019